MPVKQFLGRTMKILSKQTISFEKHFQHEKRYVLVGDRLTLHAPFKRNAGVKNTHVVFKKNRYLNKDHKEKINLPSGYYVLVVSNHNLGHFFHDVFFPLYVKWRLAKNKVIIYGYPSDFQRDFLRCVLGDEWIYYPEYDKAYISDFFIVPNEGRNLREYPDYLKICAEIKKRCFDYYGIVEDRKQRVIYTRSKQTRKKLIGLTSDFLASHSIIDYDFGSASFKETLETLASTKVFIYMVGASVFNLIFLDSTVTALEINPYRDNSWARMFGLSDACQHEIYIAQVLSNSSDARQADNVLDSNVVADERLCLKIAAVLRD